MAAALARCTNGCSVGVPISHSTQQIVHKVNFANTKVRRVVGSAQTIVLICALQSLGGELHAAGDQKAAPTGTVRSHEQQHIYMYVYLILLGIGQCNRIVLTNLLCSQGIQM